MILGVIKKHPKLSLGLAGILALILPLASQIELINASAKEIYILSLFIESPNITISTKKPPITKDNKRDSKFLTYQLRSEQDQQEGDNIKLSFFIPFDKKNRTRFEVSNYETYYTMRPTIKIFKKGFYTFSWSKEVIHQLNLGLSDLDAIGYQGWNYIIPVILHDTELPPEIKVETYSFVFRATQRGSANIRISGPKSGSVLFQKQVDVIAGSPFLIQWKLDANSAAKVPEGNLTLSISFMPVDRAFHVISSYTFYHKKIMKTDNAELLSNQREEGLFEPV